jgi:3-hydroxybutyryl-CoA dehydrogenase
METTPGIRHISVVGAGYMGHGIALGFALAGYPVRLHDRTDEILAKALAASGEDLATLVDAGAIEPNRVTPTLARIHPTTLLGEAVADADLVVEAVPEELPLKQALFTELDTLCPPHAILASNTSTFPPSALAGATRRPDRVLVAHYFHPPHLLPLVELVPSAATSAETLEAIHRLLVGIGKHPVVVRREVAGFVANRLQAALFREALAIVAEGTATAEDVDAVVTSGFGRRLAVLGLFAAMDLAGLDVVLRVMERLAPEIAASPEVPPLLRETVAAGRTGVKSGAGFRDWPPAVARDARERLARALVAIAGWPRSQPGAAGEDSDGTRRGAAEP